MRRPLPPGMSPVSLGPSDGTTPRATRSENRPIPPNASLASRAPSPTRRSPAPIPPQPRPTTSRARGFTGPVRPLDRSGGSGRSRGPGGSGGGPVRRGPSGRGPSGRGPGGPGRTTAGPGRKGKGKKPGIFWRYRRIWFLLGFLMFTGLAGAIWVITQIPLPSEAPLAQTTLIYDSTGSQIAELHGVENRFPVTIDQVPAVTQAAVIAAEDRHFLEHRGVDPVSILRATWADIRHKGAAQGGSTITQQYVKNQIVGDQRSLLRKLKEAVIAVKLERKYSKQQILEKYLNTVYFGRGAYGIQAAAQTYFNVDVSQLDLKQSSYLAGLIRTPSTGDVFSNPDTAYFLRTSVLKNMVRDHAITQADADAVEAEKIESYTFPPESADTTFTHPENGIEYYISYVKQQLFDLYGEDRVLRGGLRVTTTIDQKAQAAAYNSIYGNKPVGVLPESNESVDPIASLVSLDGDGHVVAMVGNRDWTASQVNVAVGTDGGGAGRQGGSAFKPFVLAAAIEKGISVTSKYYPGPAKIGPLDGWDGQEVHNYADASFGYINLTDATVNSVNTVYAQLVDDVGPAKVVDMAQRLGITSPLLPVPSITLGTQNVSVLEMADAYLTLYRDGTHVDPRVISKVTEGGTVLLDDKPAGVKRAVSADVAQQVKGVLGQVVARGSGTNAALPNSDVWGKTGTTDEYGDAWFVGANEKLVTAVWMGYPEGQAHALHNVEGVVNVAGGTLPALIFRNFMNIAAPGDGKSANLPSVDPRTLNATGLTGPKPTVAPTSDDSGSSASTTTTTAPATPIVTAPLAPTTTVYGPAGPVSVPGTTPSPPPSITLPTMPTTTIKRPTVTFPPGFPSSRQ